jgi:hypothetical protein
MGTEYQVLNANAKEVISAITNAVVRGFTSALITDGGRARAREVVIQVADEAIRYWTTGDDPTASIGMLAEAGTSFTIKGFHDIENFKCISTTATDAKITAQIYFTF